MIENLLTEAVINYLRAVFDENLLPTDAGGIKSPKVVDGWLPPKGSDDEPDFPYIIVRVSSGRTGDDGYSRATVRFLIGAYSEDYDGYRYVVQVLQRLRAAFMSLPSMTLDDQYKFELPFDWEMIDDQPYPEWVLSVDTQWTVVTPQMGNEEAFFQ